MPWDTMQSNSASCTQKLHGTFFSTVCVARWAKILYSWPSVGLVPWLTRLLPPLENLWASSCLQFLAEIPCRKSNGEVLQWFSVDCRTRFTWNRRSCKECRRRGSRHNRDHEFLTKCCSIYIFFLPRECQWNFKVLGLFNLLKMYWDRFLQLYSMNGCVGVVCSYYSNFNDSQDTEQQTTTLFKYGRGWLAIIL